MIIKKNNYVLIIFNIKCEKMNWNIFYILIMYKENKFKVIVDYIVEIF